MRKYGRLDGNQKPLVAYAQAFGASWVSMASLGQGVPDGLLGYHGKTWLVEFKTEDGTLTPDQDEFIAKWRGSPVHIVRTEKDVQRLLATLVK
jgi:hypothetical protein